VQTRLLACLAGGFLGVVAAAPIYTSFELKPALAFSACPVLGICLGYVASILIDVFTSSSDEG